MHLTGLRVSEVQESLELYERLYMKQEYTYTFRMLLVLLLHQGDFIKLRQILDAFRTEKSFDQVVFAKMWQGEKLFD